MPGFTFQPVYGVPTAMTITLASLASDTNLQIGRESTAVDQKDNLDAVDILVGGKVTTGTSPTTNKQIEVWAYGSYDDVEFNDPITGVDAGANATNKNQIRLLTMISTTSTSNYSYKWGPYSIAQAFGGIVPVKFGIFIVHNTGVALNATAGNHSLYYTTVKYVSV